MDNDIKTWLYDILQSIKEIESYFENRPKKFEYINDTRKKRVKKIHLMIYLQTGYHERAALASYKE